MTEHTMANVRELAGDLTNSFLKIMEESYIPEWFYTPNKHFDGKAPNEVCEAGEAERLEHLCYQILSGEPE